MATMMLTSTLRGATGMIPHALPGLHGGRLAYITTAAAVEPWGFAHTMLTRRQLRQLGFRVTELDVSTAAAPDVRSTLSDADCIYVGGGNSFFLLQELRRTGADALLAERIADGIPYIGESAGSVIMSPDIGYCSIMDRTDRAPGLRDYKGLGLTDSTWCRIWAIPRWVRRHGSSSNGIPRSSTYARSLTVNHCSSGTAAPPCCSHDGASRFGHDPFPARFAIFSPPVMGEKPGITSSLNRIYVSRG